MHTATAVLHNTSTFAGDQSQPIVISDTPSPAVSIITIHSDSEDENDRKFPAAWWALFHSVQLLVWSSPECLYFANMNSYFLLQLWNKPEDQRDQLCDSTWLPWFWLIHQQPAQPQDHLTADQVSGHHHALCEEPAWREHNPQSSSSSRSPGAEIPFSPQ